LRHHFKLVIACALSLQLATHASAAVSNSDLRAIRSELNIDQDRWIQNAEEQLPEWWRQSILKKARELEKKGQYQEALDDLLRVDKLCPHPDVNLQLALCYAHLQRKNEALSLMDKLPDYTWTTKAEIFKNSMHYSDPWRLTLKLKCHQFQEF
jgi:tetratricopeptide (TPR) repeat protein